MDGWRAAALVFSAAWLTYLALLTACTASRQSHSDGRHVAKWCTAETKIGCSFRLCRSRI